MKKQILNIGNALNKTEQKQIIGGVDIVPETVCYPVRAGYGWGCYSDCSEGDGCEVDGIVETGIVVNGLCCITFDS